MTTVLAVLGASGGLGATTLAAAVSVRAARASRPAACVDLDALGGGLDVCFGLEQDPGLRWADLAGLSGEADGEALSRRLPRSAGVPVLSFGRDDEGPPPVALAAEVVRALARVSDIAVLDTPRDGPLTALSLEQCSAAVIVAGTGAGQLAALSAVGTRVAGRVGDVSVVLRGPRGAADVALLVEGALDLPVVGCLGDDSRTAADLVHGTPPGMRTRGSVTRIADELLARTLLAHRVGAS